MGWLSEEHTLKHKYACKNTHLLKKLVSHITSHKHTCVHVARLYLLPFANARDRRTDLSVGWESDRKRGTTDVPTHEHTEICRNTHTTSHALISSSQTSAEKYACPHTYTYADAHTSTSH